jgi:hypothetical protein
MSQIGQLRKGMVTSYYNSLSYSLTNSTYKSGNYTFLDKVIDTSSGGGMTSTNTYYLKFKVKQLLNYAQTFTLKLRTSATDTINVKNLKTITIDKGSDTLEFDLIFTPIVNCTQIVFELERTSSDFSIYDNTYNCYGRVMEITISRCCRITNLIDYLSSNYSLTELKSIGLQAVPNFIFEINGEEIRVGKSGIYELDEEKVPVTNIGFPISSSDENSYFILDFKY